MNVYVTAVIKSKPEFTAEIKALLETLVTETRKEAACIKYDLHVSIEDSSVFVFYEIWQHQEGLTLHNQQPHIVAFRQAAVDKLQEAPLLFVMKAV